MWRESFCVFSPPSCRAAGFGVSHLELVAPSSWGKHSCPGSGPSLSAAGAWEVGSCVNLPLQLQILDLQLRPELPLFCDESTLLIGNPILEGSQANAEPASLGSAGRI